MHDSTDNKHRPGRLIITGETDPPLTDDQIAQLARLGSKSYLKALAIRHLRHNRVQIAVRTWPPTPISLHHQDPEPTIRHVYHRTVHYELDENAPLHGGPLLKKTHEEIRWQNKDPASREKDGVPQASSENEVHNILHPGPTP